MNINEGERNLLVTHQFVTGASVCDSEEITVGGTDNVDASVFESFDYVALGHIHGAQNCGSERIRYSGTPLKYSFSEITHQKSVSVVELLDKGELSVRTVPLIPIHDMSEIRGTFDELVAADYHVGNPIVDNYLRVTLTDEDDVPDAYARLRMIYKNLMNVRYDNKRTRENSEIADVTDVERKTPFELFAEFFTLQNNSEMSEEQSEYMKKIIEKIEEDMK